MILGYMPERSYERGLSYCSQMVNMHSSFGMMCTAKCHKLVNLGCLCGLQGDNVTSGLKKVTDDMKTKNRTDRSGAVPSSAPSATSTAKCKQACMPVSHITAAFSRDVLAEAALISVTHLAFDYLIRRL